MQVKILTTKLKQYLYFCHYFSTSTFHSREKNSPYDILGVNPSSSFNDIKKAYHNLSKIYHPDKNQSHDASEKFKTINNAYNTLKEYHEESNNYKQNKNSKPYEQRNNQKCYNTSPNQTKEDKTSNRSFYKTEAEDLYEKIFGKSYSSDPMAYYSPENFELRKEYEEKLKKIKEKKKEREEKNHETMRQGFENQQKYYHHEEDQKNIKLDPLFWIVSGGASLIVFFLVFWSKRRDTASIILLKENEILINKLREKELKKSKEKFDNTIEKFNKSYGRMKKYTISNEPKALDILIDYTIYPDINIYSVPSKCFYGEKLQSDEFILSNEFEKQKLREIKLNTAISISLEAERCLKNIYVHIPTLQNTLQNQGFYEPPRVFMRFFGFLQIKLRKMPMIVEKLKSETTWISIFDLYFKYRSPLPASHDDFYEFKVEAEVGWLGNVTLNHRKIPKVFLQGNEKNIFMWRGSSDFKWQESLYKQIWENFYKENHF